jgi:hypothetical protein
LLRILEGMNAFLSKLTVLGVVAGGFYATGDLPRLIERGRRITERTSVPFPAGPAPAVGPSTQAPVPPPKPTPPAKQVPLPEPPHVDPPQAIDNAANEPTRIPMPPLDLEAVDLAAMRPGQRVLLVSGRLVIALDVVDGPAGEVLEHSHAIHADRTLTIASTAAPRRLVVTGCSSGSARPKPRSDRRIARGEFLHVLPSGSAPRAGVTPASETIGPIEAIGLE